MNSSFRCVARKGAFVSGALDGRSGMVASACATGCTAIGDFQLTDPLARIVLTWGATPSDLDTHLVGADHAAGGVHIAFWDMGSLVAAPYIELDTDDTDSYGPEILSFVHGAPAQRYRYCVHNYSSYSPGPPVESLPTSGAVVDAFLAGGHVHVPVPTAANANDLWRVLEFTLDASGTATQVHVLNDFRDVSSVDEAFACMGP